MDTMNNHEAIEAIKYCLDTNTPYGGSKASTSKDE